MCGIFGMVFYNSGQINSTSLMKTLALHSVHRGKDATGFAWFKKERPIVVKSPGPATEFDYNKLTNANIMIGHVRQATSGPAKFNENNHPFVGQTEYDDKFALAHNGIIWTPQIAESPIETDTYAAVQFLELEDVVDIKSVKGMCEQISGSFLFTILSSNGIFLAKDTSPCTIAHIPDLKLWIYASEKEIIERTLSEFNNFDNVEIKYLDMKDGDIYHITVAGELIKGSFDISSYFGNSTMEDVEEIVDMYNWKCLSAEEAMTQIEAMIWGGYERIKNRQGSAKKAERRAARRLSIRGNKTSTF